MSELLTWDVLLHCLVAALLVYAMLPLGLWSIPLAVGLGFYVREMEQSAPKGERWKPWLWSWHRHCEWAAPFFVAFLTFSLL